MFAAWLGSESEWCSKLWIRSQKLLETSLKVLGLWKKRNNNNNHFHKITILGTCKKWFRTEKDLEEGNAEVFDKFTSLSHFQPQPFVSQNWLFQKWVPFRCHRSHNLSEFVAYFRLKTYSLLQLTKSETISHYYGGLETRG